ncbi:MAG: hypothetical protein AAB480_02635 [Patescibacteria group bacterium]
MKRLIVTGKKLKTPKQFSPESIANRILLECGFEGKTARVKYANGKLTIRFGKKIDIA